MSATLVSYVPRPRGGFASLRLPDGSRVLLSLADDTLSLHRLHLWGRVPGRPIAALAAAGLAPLLDSLMQAAERLPPLPNEAAMMVVIDRATLALQQVAAGAKPIDVDGPPDRLELLTRFALTASSREDLARRFERAAAGWIPET